jgi:uncharacterized protein (DUF427 family)
MIPTEVRKRSPPSPGPSPIDPEGSADHDDEVMSSESQRRFRCRACGTTIAEEQDLITIAGSGPQVYVNPHGILFEILTVGNATNLFGIGESTTTFTWFAGYAWQVVVCASCTTHIGWVYDAVTDSDPQRFYGLIRAKLTDSP